MDKLGSPWSALVLNIGIPARSEILRSFQGFVGHDAPGHLICFLGSAAEDLENLNSQNLDQLAVVLTDLADLGLPLPPSCCFTVFYTGQATRETSNTVNSTQFRSFEP